jgi:hypothetical protein
LRNSKTPGIWLFSKITDQDDDIEIRLSMREILEAGGSVFDAVAVGPL